MAEFVIKVADERGRMHQQVEQGYSIAEVRDRFASQGYLVYWVKPQGMFSGGIRKRRKLKPTAFLVYNQQFLTLIKAGLPILNALDLLIKRQKDATLRQILENVRERVKGGELLSDAFASHAVVPKIYTTTLMAGEKSGNIDEVLSRYINFQRLAMTFRKKLAVSLIYPTLLVTVVTIMVMFLFTYVVPKFAELFNSLDAKLPTITVFMLAVGQNAQKYAPFGAIGLVLFIFVFLQWRKTDRGSDQIDRFILSLPMIGGIRLKHQVATFSRMLATLLQGGLPLVPSMETAGQSMTSKRILKGVMRASIRVREGQGLAGSLEEQGIFPDLAVEMLEVGESTGALPAMLNSVAEFYEEDVQTALGASMALIEPLILIIMAVFVGGVLISLYLPIFTLGVH
ncbi:MAG TPA: type II secretion system F family protein [Candidatus Sulfotelmatobacter sp.]|jgi:type IV pilus assembly protein PilC